ncbi:MAG TPA: serine hydrolase domain-containing protein [Pseudonocardiaceae bacterium]
MLAAEVADWPVGVAAVAVVGPDGVLARTGPDERLRWASVTKLLTAATVLLAADEGTVDLDEPAGPPGSTVRHLLAHASGLTLRGTTGPAAAPGTVRIYSNKGYEELAELLVRRTGEPFADRVRRRLLAPLRMRDTTLLGSPASGAVGPLADLALFAHELLAPVHLPPALLAEAVTCAYPGLPGELPGFGHQERNDWGLGFELRDGKAPHWTSDGNSPRTYGHFGQAGSFLWVDPDADLACVSLSDTPFGTWSADRWPRLSTRVLAALRG